MELQHETSFMKLVIMHNLMKHKNLYISILIKKGILKMARILIYDIISNELFDVHRKYKLLP
jgi:hypothetical protein